MARKSASWNLYWVESDGIEDCFVVAKNSRSARQVEIEMNGFELDEVRATKIMRVPVKVQLAYEKRKKHPWPWYVYGKAFFLGLGAQFRKLEGKKEMLLEQVVYEIDDYIPCSMRRSRSIGAKALSEMDEVPEFAEIDHHEEDVWKGRQVHLISMLGMSLARCQRIEFYIAHAFLLGISKQQKAKYQTLDDMRKGWEKKTLGQMLRAIEEAWEIEPTVKASFDLFLWQRNQLIHGITTKDRYDIQTAWGQDELVSFLAFFDIHSRLVKKVFRGALHASFGYALHHWGRPKGLPKNYPPPEHEEDADFFFEVFKLKEDAV